MLFGCRDTGADNADCVRREPLTLISGRQPNENNQQMI